MKDTDYIYALKCRTVDRDFVYFYVGRSIEPGVRITAHQRDSKTGTESKYQYIRELEANGQPWFMELLAEVTTEDDNYEDYYVWKLLSEGHPLKNMKAGDARQAALEDAERSMREAGARYSDAQSFLSARERAVKEAEARAATARLQARATKEDRRTDSGAPGETLFSWETPKEFSKRIESAGLKALRARSHTHRGPKRI